jgi:hypothetical protein
MPSSMVVAPGSRWKNGTRGPQRNYEGSALSNTDIDSNGNMPAICDLAIP